MAALELEVVDVAEGEPPQREERVLVLAEVGDGARLRARGSGRRRRGGRRGFVVGLARVRVRVSLG